MIRIWFYAIVCIMLLFAIGCNKQKLGILLGNPNVNLFGKP